MKSWDRCSQKGLRVMVPLLHAGLEFDERGGNAEARRDRGTPAIGVRCDEVRRQWFGRS